MIKRYLLTASLCLTVPFLVPSGISASTVNTNIVNETIIGPLEQKDAGVTIDESTKDTVEEKTTEEENEYANLAFSIANNYVNIRKKPDLESEVVGKLYEGSAATVIFEKDDWVKVESGNVTGYISKEFLAIGEDAENLLDEYATKTATVSTETLKVREKPDTESDCLTLIGEGDICNVTKESANWVKIKINSSETSAKLGYISKEYVDVAYEYDYAISIEEELARTAAEEAARQAQLAVQSSTSSVSSYSGSSSSSSSLNASVGSYSSSASASASTGTATGSRIASYATQFVGNPYVWGGTSLTNGTDCSGFTQSVFRNFGYSIPRTSGTQASAGTSVSVNNIQAGDLIFYAEGGTVSHVALYIGGGKVVHASNAKDGIKISQYNYRSIYSIRRIV